MERDGQPRNNADQLESALARHRSALSLIADDEERARREGAIEQLVHYVALLRDSGAAETWLADPAVGLSFSFKLEYEDGRWQIDEKTLTITPRVGDVLSFDDGRNWRVRTSQLVNPRPAGKPAREFFVCAPAA